MSTAPSVAHGRRAIVTDVHVDLLGPLRVRRDDGVEVPVAGARLRRLLVELALVPGRPVSTAALEDALWEDGGGAGALQSLVSRLRRVLGGAGTVTAGPAGYTLAVDPQDVDVVRFERACSRGRELLRTGDVEAAGEELSAGLALWRGMPTELDGSPEAARLDRRRLDALADRVEADLRRGSLEGLDTELEGLATAHPHRERFAELRVRVLHAEGRTAEALAAFEQTRQALAEEFGTDPSAGLRAAHLAALTQEVVPGPRRAPAAPDVVPLTSFVGRGPDLDRLRQLLSTARCVTLVGPGGAGKTRLSTEVVVRANGGRRTHVVALAPVGEGSDVLGAALAAVGVQESARDRVRPLAGHVDPFGSLVMALSGAPALLVLDNCEHLLDDAARLTEDLLRRCPDLVVLATSREALGVEGEVLHPLAPLRAPDPGAPLTEVLANPAVRLFTDRAVAVSPGFVVTAENSELVVDLVRRLDGLPLALELAAARLRTMSPADLLDRLADRFRLLAGGRRTAVARHRTLRAVVDWSWDLLDDDERRMLGRLSVFGAPFTVQAAVAVSGCPGDGRTPDALDAADLLASLTEKSLLHLVGSRSADAPTRYGQLETIREYARERLVASGDLEGVLAARTDWALAECEAAASGLRGPGQVAWSRRLDAESEDLLAGLRHLVATDRGEEALRMVLPVALWWLALGRHAVVRDWLTVARSARVSSSSQAAVLLTVLHLINGVMGGQGTWTDDTGALRAVRAELSAAGEGPHRAIAFFADLFLGAFIEEDEGTPTFPAGLPADVAGQDPFVTAVFHLMRAASAENDGEIDAMARHARDAEEGFRSVGESFGRSSALRLQGHEATYAGDLPRAVRAYAGAVEAITAFGTVDDEVHLRMRLADVLGRSGDRDGERAEVARLHRAAATTSPSTATWVALVDAGLARREGRPEDARAAVDRLLGQLDLRPADPTYAHERAALGTVAVHLELDAGRLPRARELLGDTHAVATATADMPVVALFGVAVARWRFLAGDPRAGAVTLGTSAAVRGAQDATDPDVTALRRELTAALGPEGFETAYDAGRGTDRATALARLDPAAREPVDP